MESILCPDMLNIIYTFLDKKSLAKYDSANLNKKNREIMLYTFQNYYNYNFDTCSWTILRGIKFISQICKVKYINYVSSVCKKLILHGKGDINIINDNIEKLYIDMYLNKRIENIICKKLKNLTIILDGNVQFNSHIFEFLEYNCPKLENLFLVRCNISADISNLIKNKNKNIKVRIA